MVQDAERAAFVKPHRPRFLNFRSSNSFILATVCVAHFTDSFVYAVVVPVLPFSLRERSGVPAEDLQWWNSTILAAFGLAIIIGAPICGWVADRTTSRSIPFYAGLFMLATGTLIFGVARNPWVLVLSRLLQGLSNSVVFTVGLALLVDTAGREKLGRMMGTFLSSASFGFIISPMLGGVVYARAGYYAVFAMSLTLVVVDVLMRLVMIEKKTAAKWRLVKSGVYGTFAEGSPTRERSQRPDTPNAFANGSAHSPAAANGRVGSPTANGSAAAQPPKTPDTPAVPTTPARQSRVPTIFRLLVLPRLWAAIYCIFVETAVMVAFDPVLPAFVREKFNWDPQAAGVIFLCLAMPSLSGALVGHLVDRLGPKWIATAGCLGMAPALFCLRLVREDTLGDKVLLCILLAICGFTSLFIISPAATDVSFVVAQAEEKEPGIFGPGGADAQAFALFNVAMACGILFGPILAGWLRENYGWATMSLVLGFFALSAGIPAVLLIGGRLFEKKKQPEQRPEEEERLLNEEE